MDELNSKKEVLINKYANFWIGPYALMFNWQLIDHPVDM